MIHKIEAIVKEAAGIMLSQQPMGIESKEGHANFVTQADKKTQDFLQSKLMELLPGSTLYGEEQDNAPLGPGPTWVVDPIDGTLNYIHGLMHSAISIALSENRQITLAVIYNPYRDELFTAQKGQGAYLNGQVIRCSRQPLERAVSFFGTSPYQASLAQASFHTAGLLLNATADVRRFGAATLDLAYLACGRADIFFEFALSPWDYAAGKLLIEEAGGIFHFLNLNNDRLDFSGPAAVFAANPLCAEPALKLVEEGYATCVTLPH